MPTNLPPEAVEAERRFKEAKTTEEKITTLEAYLSAIPKHKGTDRLRADLRRRLSKLKGTAQAERKAARQVSVYRLEREGAGQAVLVGPANVGKSALVAALTNASPEVADYPYTTWTPVPGMMPIENIQVQLIDTPPLKREFIEPDFMELARRTDLILLVVDLTTDPLEQLDEISSLLRGQHIIPKHHRDRYPDDQRLAFVPFLVLVSKSDDESADEDFGALSELLGDEWPLIPVSAATGRNLDRLKRAVYEELGIMRVYSKPPNKKPDLNEPFVVKRGCTLIDFAAKVHQDFARQLKEARVWGTDVFDGQSVSRDHVLHDGDVVELRV